MVGTLFKMVSLTNANLLLIMGFAFLGVFLLKSIVFPINKNVEK